MVDALGGEETQELWEVEPQRYLPEGQSFQAYNTVSEIRDGQNALLFNTPGSIITPRTNQGNFVVIHVFDPSKPHPNNNGYYFIDQNTYQEILTMPENKRERGVQRGASMTINNPRENTWGQIARTFREMPIFDRRSKFDSSEDPTVPEDPKVPEVPDFGLSPRAVLLVLAKVSDPLYVIKSNIFPAAIREEREARAAGEAAIQKLMGEYDAGTKISPGVVMQMARKYGCSGTDFDSMRATRDSLYQRSRK